MKKRVIDIKIFPLHKTTITKAVYPLHLHKFTAILDQERRIQAKIRSVIMESHDEFAVETIDTAEERDLFDQSALRM